MRYISYCISTFLLLFILSSCGSESTPVYNLTTTPTPDEAGSVSPSSGEYDEGESVEITATPNDDWVFESWEGDASGSDNPTTVTIDADKDIAAVFVVREYPLTIEIEGEGTVQEEVVQGKTTDYETGTVVELTAEAADGWKFIGWEGDLEGTDNPQTITIDSDKSVTANFERQDYPLTINIDGEGTVEEEVIQSKTTDYPYETNVELTAKPAEGWVFSHWEDDLSGEDNPATIEIINSKNITAIFVEPFYLHENGVTVMCPKAEIGGSGEVNGRVFTKRTRDEITFDNAVSTCTSSITDMSNLFSRSGFDESFDSNSFNEYITHWDVSSVTDMSSMFYNQTFNRPINEWDVSKVEDMSGMFYNSSFNQELGDWDVSNVKNVKEMFYESDFNQDISNWNVENVTDMSGLFYETPFNQEINSWNVSNVKSMSLMFAHSSFNEEINSWNVSSVIDMSGMFKESNFNQDISNWDVSNVTDMSNMFATLVDPENPLSSGTPTPFNQPIGVWDVSNVTDMSGMFRESHFNQEIGNWDVSNVADMNRMFYSNSEFDQDISNWNVNNVSNMSFMFAGRAATQNEILNNNLDGTPLPSPTDFNQDIESWDVSKVTDMSFMFERSTFDQSINNWDVSNVTSMEGMFKISEFDNNIVDWDVSSVTNMDEMFNRASNFNQDISLWCVGSIYSEPDDFSTDSPLLDENKPVWGTCPE